MVVTTTSNQRPAAPAAPAGRLQHLPITLFASVMGLGGLSLAWRRAALVWDVSPRIAQVIFWVALATFVLLAVLYAGKWARHPAAARAELRHPIRMAFVPTTTIGLLILATAGQDLLPEAARVAWWVGALGHLTLTVVILGAWFGRARHRTLPGDPGVVHPGRRQRHHAARRADASARPSWAGSPGASGSSSGSPCCPC